MVQGEEVGEVNETDAGSQKKGNFAIISPTPIENRSLNIRKFLLTGDVQKWNRNTEGGTKKKKGLGRFKLAHKKR